jgi:hypothetical protein
MSTAVKNAAVPADKFIAAVVRGRNEKKSNKDIAAGLNMEVGTFNVRLTALKKQVKKTPGGEALLERLGGATRMPKVDAFGLLSAALDAIVSPDGTVEEFNEDGSPKVTTKDGEIVG